MKKAGKRLAAVRLNTHDVSSKTCAGHVGHLRRKPSAEIDIQLITTTHHHDHVSMLGAGKPGRFKASLAMVDV